MKVILSGIVALGFSFAVNASDAEKSGSTTVDTSKNPITGTQKTTVEKKMKKKGVDGQDVEATTTTTTKKYKDGKTDKSVEHESEPKATRP